MRESPEIAAEFSFEKEKAIAKSFSQRFQWEMILIGLGQAVIWLSLWPLVLNGIIDLWVGFLIASLCACFAYLPSHEAQHGNYSRGNSKLRWLDGFVGHITLITLIYPYQSSSSNFSSDNLSIFGNIDYFLDEFTKLSIGARWEDYQSNYYDSFGESFNPNDQMSGGKISLNKNLSDVANIFISVARGFNQGGFNLNLGLAPDSKNTNLYYDPEFLTNYEVGFNAQLFDAKTNIAAVIFYSDREDQQVLISTQVDPTDPNTFSFLTQNAAEGTNKGLELNIDVQLTESLNFFARLGLLRTEINNWKSRPDLEGRAQAHAPKKSYAFGMNWSITNRASLSADVVGKSSFYYSDSHNNQSKSYSLTNINFDYLIGRWTYSIWARNIFDEYYSVVPNIVNITYGRSEPIFSISASILSFKLSLLTPEGVPVNIASPALSVINFDNQLINSSTFHAIFTRLLDCFF